MLKEIPVSQLRKGMYLNKLCGSWLSHPFWKQSFVIDEVAKINAIKESGIKRVIIDTSKGLDVLAEVKEKPATKPEAPKAAKAKPKKITLSEEWNKAKKICDQAKGEVTKMFQEVRMGKAVNIKNIQPIVENITDSVTRNPTALINVARLKTVDDYTYLHSVAVCAMMAALARQLNMSEEETFIAAQGGMLHDVGKAGIPVDVLNKPGKLTDNEFDVVRRHPEKGYDMLVSNETLPEEVLDVALHHHEKFDGRGYPHKLKGEEISIFARMGAVCDVYDALTSDRVYKKGWSPAVAVKRMASWEGHFDPKILQAFIKTLGIYPVGSLVRLKSDKLGIVTEQSDSSLLQPKVKVFFSAKSKAPIDIAVMDLAANNCQDSIVGIEDPDKWNFKDLDKLWIPDT